MSKETGKMDENESRLAECFLAVFPDLPTDVIVHASSTSIQNWDSVATVTLLAVVEEEFGINIDVKDLARFDSFNGILIFLQESQQPAENSYDQDLAV
jgi:acyl carrier protein